MIAVTGATGHLGRQVMEQLLEKAPAYQIIAAIRNPDKAKDLASRGVQVRKADYDDPNTLQRALQGVEDLLFISASEVGKRARQHEAVIEAAKQAGVGRVIYTSLLRADSARMSLGAEHRATERAIRDSGMSFTILRNSWYIENYTENLGPALQYGTIMGAADGGRISAATRADYAAAAVAVLTTQGHADKIYELGGDNAFTMAELAAEVARHSGKPVVYKDMPADEYAKALQGFGVPQPVAEMYASADEGISRGELFTQSSDLHRLIGRATTSLSEAVAVALEQ